jgi:hypothetical protein
MDKVRVNELERKGRSQRANASRDACGEGPSFKALEDGAVTGQESRMKDLVSPTARVGRNFPEA